MTELSPEQTNEAFSAMLALEQVLSERFGDGKEFVTDAEIDEQAWKLYQTGIAHGRGELYVK